MFVGKLCVRFVIMQWKLSLKNSEVARSNAEMPELGILARMVVWTVDTQLNVPLLPAAFHSVYSTG